MHLRAREPVVDGEREERDGAEPRAGTRERLSGLVRADHRDDECRDRNREHERERASRLCRDARRVPLHRAIGGVFECRGRRHREPEGAEGREEMRAARTAEPRGGPLERRLMQEEHRVRAAAEPLRGRREVRLGAENRLPHRPEDPRHADRDEQIRDERAGKRERRRESERVAEQRHREDRERRWCTRSARACAARDDQLREHHPRGELGEA